MNKYIQREQSLMSVLTQKSRVTTPEAVELLNVSEATARRLFSSLETKGKVIRDYGGIQLSSQHDHYFFEKLEKEDVEEKKRIGHLAASFVQNGDTIYLDCGTTISYMAMSLADRMKQEQLQPQNIITNSIANVRILSVVPSCRVILVGGVYNPNRRDFSGPLTEKYLSDFHFKKAFLGCDGISAEMGFTSNELEISRLNASVLKHSDYSYVLGGLKKFDKKSFISYASLSEINVLITDGVPDGRIAHTLEEKGVKVLVAEK
jgi:DeoR/GlpR family transcriptional regulator of sugar metabolism